MKGVEAKQSSDTVMVDWQFDFVIKLGANQIKANAGIHGLLKCLEVKFTEIFLYITLNNP